jgi:O-antigen ligase
MDRLLHIALMLLVALAPLPLGSNREWSWTLCALIAGLLGALWAASALARRRPIAGLPVAVWLPFVLVCAWVLVQAFGAAPAGWHHPAWSLATEKLGISLAGGISLSREDSLVALMRLMAYGTVFLLSFQLSRDLRRATATFRWLAGAGLIYAVAGLAVYWGNVDTTEWFSGLGTDQAVRGPFVNRNSFATYLGLCLLCLLVMTYRRLALRRNPMYRLPPGRQRTIEQYILQSWQPLAAVLLMVSALILTHSRAGFASFLVGALVLTLAIHYRSRLASMRSVAAIAAAFAVSVTAFFMTSRILLNRLDDLLIDAPGRSDAYRLAGAAVRDNPWLGFGYGTFGDSFRLYRTDALTAHYARAHNTWLENIFELGWPAASLLFLCLGCLAWMCLRGLRERGRDWIFPAAGLAAATLAAVHSLFDFSLQIPAVALAWACLMGTACAQSLPGRHPHSAGAHRRT